MGKFADLTGMRFGKLQVVERGPDAIVGKNNLCFVQWRCRCDCGQMTLVRADALKSGKTKSCGCLRIEKAVKTGHANGKSNRFDVKEDFVVGYTTKGEPFYFDREDYDLVSQYCWYIHHSGYVTADKNGRFILLHRLVMNAKPDEVIDHINHQLENACKQNLRVVTLTQNLCNSRNWSTNTSGVKGVHYEKGTGKWVAQLRVDREHFFLGRFESFDEAVAARKAAEEKYFGEYSYDNSIAASPVIEVA